MPKKHSVHTELKSLKKRLKGIEERDKLIRERAYQLFLVLLGAILAWLLTLG